MKHQIGQWTYEVHQDHVLAYTEKGDEHLFYELHSGTYGNPVFLDEPARRVELPTNVNFVDLHRQPTKVDAPAFVTGVICIDADSNEVLRSSLSNPAFDTWQLKASGLEAHSPNQDVWHLDSLLLKDAHRFVGNGYVGVYRPTKPSEVRVFELIDIARLL